MPILLIRSQILSGLRNSKAASLAVVSLQASLTHRPPARSESKNLSFLKTLSSSKRNSHQNFLTAHQFLAKSPNSPQPCVCQSPSITEANTPQPLSQKVWISSPQGEKARTTCSRTWQNWQYLFHPCLLKIQDPKQMARNSYRLRKLDKLKLATRKLLRMVLVKLRKFLQ